MGPSANPVRLYSVFAKSRSFRCRVQSWTYLLKLSANGHLHETWSKRFTATSTRYQTVPGICTPYINDTLWQVHVLHWSSQLISQFQVPFASVSKQVQVQNLSRHENQFSSQVHSDGNLTHFQMKGFHLDSVWNRGRRQLGNGLFKLYWKSYNYALVLMIKICCHLRTLTAQAMGIAAALTHT